MADTTIAVTQLSDDKPVKSSSLSIKRESGEIKIYLNGVLYGQTSDYETARKELTEYVASVAGEMFDKGMAA